MDNWLIYLIVLLTYFDLKSALKKILNNQSQNSKKDFSLLENLKNKEIQIEVDDEDINVFGTTKKGILKDFNDVWLVLEIVSKKGKELVYYRVSNIKGVVEVKQ